VVYPTREENLFHCIPYRKNINSGPKINLFSKIHSTHESGSQVEYFDEKNEFEKSRGTIPLKIVNQYNYEEN
jgi:hypothetical protein